MNVTTIIVYGIGNSDWSVDLGFPIRERRAVNGRLNVRCCCKPSKILGTLPDPGPDSPGIMIRLAPDLFETLVTPENDPYLSGLVPLPIDTYCEYEKTGEIRERSFKSNDYPIEVLRQIPGFEEAKRR